MKIKVDRKIVDTYPGVRLGVVFALGIDNSKKGLFLDKLRSEEVSARKMLDGVDLAGHKHIAPWREIYRSFGSKPSEYNSSIEALLKRVVKGKDLSDINPLVNLYNSLSLKYVLPFGGEDLDKVKGDVRLSFCEGNESGTYLGSDEPEFCNKGEVAYLDDLGFICRRWNWREGKRTMLTEKTRNVVMVIEAASVVSDEVLKLATEELADKIRLNLGGETNIYYLDENHLEVSVNFETGSSLGATEASVLQTNKVESVKNKKGFYSKRESKKDKVPTKGIASQIYGVIEKICETEKFSVERSSDETRGDFACNVAMVLAKTEGKNPRELAEEIVEKLKTNKDLEHVIDLEKIEVAGPGFINFWVRDEYLSLAMGLAGSDHWGQSEFMKGKRVLVEYSSPNIAKRFSVGHLRSTIIGNALYNLYKASGAKVADDNHLGDWGTQFGMIVAAVEEENLDISNMSVGELEELYVRFNKRITENPDLKDKARDAFLRLEQGDQNARKIWQMAVDVSMKEFNVIYKKLGVSFENMFGESVYESQMPKIIEDLKTKKIAVEGERGAYIIKFEKNSKEYMPPAMLLKSDGTTTYLTRDLATIEKRLTEEKLKSDLYVYEVGSEQKLHFRQVFETARMLWPKETENVKFVHVAHGLLTLPEGKMSTRKGNTIKLEDLIMRAEEEAFSYMTEKTGLRLSSDSGQVSDQSQIDKPSKAINISDNLAINSIKYNELRRSPELNYVFRWDEALAMEGNSAPYINYAYVRARKIVDSRSLVADKQIVFEGEEKELARLLMRFAEGEVVEEAAKNFAPHLLAGYLFEVAKKFNAFYDHNKVLGDSREIERLVLVNAVAEVLKNGMRLLGIEVVEKM